jgi:hypothetical protein
MKKIMLVLSIVLLTQFAEAQWYFKKYKINDINLLTKEQPDASLKDSKNATLISGIAAGLGAGLFILSRYDVRNSDENPTFIEQLIGKQGMHKIYAGSGILLLTVGTVSIFGYLERTKDIKMLIHKNYPPLGSIHFSPKIGYN